MRGCSLTFRIVYLGAANTKSTQNVFDYLNACAPALRAFIDLHLGDNTTNPVVRNLLQKMKDTCWYSGNWDQLLTDGVLSVIWLS
jgi:hypothetical protein